MIIKSKYILVVTLYSTIIAFIVSHVISANYVKAEWSIQLISDINANNRTIAQLYRHSGMIFYDINQCTVKLKNFDPINLTNVYIKNGYTLRTVCKFVENIDDINIVIKYCQLATLFCMFTTIALFVSLWIKIEVRKKNKSYDISQNVFYRNN